jgi:hypothetical protein
MTLNVDRGFDGWDSITTPPAASGATTSSSISATSIERRDMARSLRERL